MDTFDLVRFTVPPGTREARAGSLSFTQSSARTFCRAAMYSSLPSNGSVDADLREEWRLITLRSTVVSEEAPAQSDAGGGWTRVSKGGALQSADAGRFRVRMVMFSGNGRRTSAFVQSNDSTMCAPTVESFLGSLRIAAPPAPVAISTPSGTATAGAAITGPVAPTAEQMSGLIGIGVVPGTQVDVPATVIGAWEYMTATTPAMRYNAMTKLFESGPPTVGRQYKQAWRLRFLASGRYVRQLDEEDFTNRRATRTLETGRWSLTGNTIRFTPESLKTGGAVLNAQPALAEAKVPSTYTLRVQLGDPPPGWTVRGLHVADAQGSWKSYKAIQGL
jgi:hypothetical protein